MSNSTAPEIAALYEDSKDVKAAGLRCYRIPARRAINSNAQRRGVVDEYVITNVRVESASLRLTPGLSASLERGHPQVPGRLEQVCDEHPANDRGPVARRSPSASGIMGIRDQERFAAGLSR